MIEFVIFGAPVAKGRARTVRTRRGGVRTFTPSKTTTAEALIRQEAMVAMVGKRPIVGPVAVRLSFFLPVPPSWAHSRRHQASIGRIYPAGRPDLDNLIKTVCDACNGIVWLDDAQAVKIEASKDYCETPRTIINVRPL